MSREDDFLKIIINNQGILHKVTKMYYSSPEEQNDLFQEIVLQLWHAYPSFRGDSKITTWMYKVALNTAITLFRKDKKNKSHDSITNNTINFPDISQQTQRDKFEDISMLYKAIEKLSKTDRAIILLYLEEYKNKEIAEIIGISEGNIRVKLTRIRKKLKNLIEV